MTNILTHLGDMPVETFLRDYWQKRPLLIRNALPDFESPLAADELAGLSLEQEIESRIIVEHGLSEKNQTAKPWQLHCGPFDESIYGQLPESHWTLLVQAVDQWIPEVTELRDHFRFIPSWRLDDVMISYAPDQGSVGPHFDYYDVFLLQGQGKRRWRLGQTCDSQSPCLAGTDLHILQDFEQQQEYLLEPGDMLYIPPRVAHWGVAEGECITYSIGFRAPSHADFIGDLCQEFTSHLNNDQRYSDATLKLQTNPGEIAPAAIEQLQEIIKPLLQPQRLGQWLGQYMTASKYDDQDMVPEQPPTQQEWQQRLQTGECLYHHPGARFAFIDQSETQLFANGQTYPCAKPLAELLCRDGTIDSEPLLAQLDNDNNLELLEQLIQQGCLIFNEEH